MVQGLLHKLSALTSLRTCSYTALNYILRPLVSTVAVIMATFESFLTIKHLDQPSLVSPRQNHVSVHTRQSEFIMSSPPLPSASNPRRRSRASLSSVQFPVPGASAPELSNVPCYTCRRRHVKCDRILPHWYDKSNAAMTETVITTYLVPSAPKRVWHVWATVCQRRPADKSRNVLVEH
jgi:hypothetical protein